MFAGSRPPSEIPGLGEELVSRMSAGLVCPMQPLDAATRESLFRRWIEQRCLLPWPDETVDELVQIVSGNGRMISGLVNLVNTLQRMYRRMPSISEIRQFGGEMLRSQRR